jgi:heat shock protein HslJ
MPTVHAIRVSNDEISLADSEGRPVLTGRKLRASGLENRTWRIESYFDGTSLVRAVEEFSAPPAPHLAFVHGNLYGSPGCGGFIGFYSLRQSDVTIHAGSILAGYCPPQNIKRSDTVSDALSGERVIERAGDRLILRDSDGQTRIVLTPGDKE